MSYKIPFVYKLLSWIFPFNLEKIASKYSEILEVNLQYGKLVVDSPNANYSYGNLHLIFQKAFQRVNFIKEKHYDVLILGFGAGSIAQILHQELQIEHKVIGVEIDPKMIYIAKKYFSNSFSNNTKIIEKDANAFMMTNHQKFDLVTIDLFIDLAIPSIFEQLDFIEKVKQTLQPNGILIWNTIAENAQFKENLFSTFKNLQSYKIQTNTVFIYNHI